MGAVNFIFGQGDQPIEMPEVPLLQEGIQQHGAERRRQRDRQAGGHAVIVPALEIWMSGK